MRLITPSCQTQQLLLIQEKGYNLVIDLECRVGKFLMRRRSIRRGRGRIRRRAHSATTSTPKPITTETTEISKN